MEKSCEPQISRHVLDHRNVLMLVNVQIVSQKKKAKENIVKKKKKKQQSCEIPQMSANFGNVVQECLWFNFVYRFIYLSCLSFQLCVFCDSM